MLKLPALIIRNFPVFFLEQLDKCVNKSAFSAFSQTRQKLRNYSVLASLLECQEEDNDSDRQKRRTKAAEPSVMQTGIAVYRGLWPPRSRKNVSHSGNVFRGWKLRPYVTTSAEI